MIQKNAPKMQYFSHFFVIYAKNRMPGNRLNLYSKKSNFYNAELTKKSIPNNPLTYDQRGSS